MLQRLPPTWQRVLSVVALLAWCTACGSNGSGPVGPQPGASCPETPCFLGQVCSEGACVDVSADCSPACASGEVCAQGRCLQDNGQCESFGASCNPQLATRQGRFCVAWTTNQPQEGTCSPPCGEGGSCDGGSACYLLNAVVDPPCGANGACSDGRICAQGACRAAACRPSECDGLVRGQSQCDALYGAGRFKCYELPDEANFCFEAGARALGEPCIDDLAALQSQTFDTSCGVGLACIRGQCQLACSGDSACTGDQGDCLFASANAAGRGVGFCGRGCTPFETGECGDGRACQPAIAGTGFCVEAGDKPAFARCDLEANDCSDGTICVSFQGDNQLPGAASESRCMPLCDVSVADPDDSGFLNAAALEARDATCPQPDVVERAWLRVAHMAQGAGALDVYLDDEMTPRLSALAFEGAGEAFIELEPGRRAVAFRTAGAPRSDAPVARVDFDAAVDGGSVVLAVAPDPSTAAAAQPVVVDAVATGAAARADWVHTIADAGAIDIVATTPGGALDGSEQVLASNLGFGQSQEAAMLPAGEVDLYVFAAGSARMAGAEALLLRDQDLSGATSRALILRGTLDPDDANAAGLSVLERLVLPEAVDREPRLTCISLGNESYGYCAQVCDASSARYTTGVCSGEAMGCAPVSLTDRVNWRSLCRPVGEGAQGDSCMAEEGLSACGEGSYCLAYGGAEPSGECAGYCSTDEGAGLSCATAGQSCEPLDATAGGYPIGRCGFRCTPGEVYGDMSCPQGLRACLPTATLREDLSGSGDAAPIVVRGETFCSASGDAAAGAPCTVNGCVPGHSCLFERSEQTDLVSTLLSPYFPTAGAMPVCRPQCDPFDGDSSAVQCGEDETCLVNFPWSAEVGHCAPIVERLSPFAPCERPGLACGEDAVCTFFGGRAVCLRLCDYIGGSSRDSYERSSCPEGLQCSPLINDVGFCERPQP